MTRPFTTTFTTMYVAHDIECPIHDVSLAIDRLHEHVEHAGLSLRIDRADTPRPRLACDPWRALPGALRVGRLRPAFRVSLEAVPWSATRSQVAIRPDGRTCEVWPRRFCDAASTMVTHLERVLSAAVAASAPVPLPGRLTCQVHDVGFDDGATFALVKVAGDLHQETRDQLRDEMIAPIDAGPARVLVDLAGLRSVDDAGLETLAMITEVAEREIPDGTLTLTAVPEPIRDTIAVSGYGHLLAVA